MYLERVGSMYKFKSGKLLINNPNEETLDALTKPEGRRRVFRALQSEGFKTGVWSSIPLGRR